MYRLSPAVCFYAANNLLRTVILAVCFWAAAGVGAELALDIQPNRTQIYLGESLLLNVIVNGADVGLPTPDISALKADVQLLAQRSLSQYTFTQVNGRISRSATKARLFSFQVKPHDAGVFATGPIKLSFNGQSYAEHGPNIQVTGQESQNLVVAGVSASREFVLVDEPFTITLSVAVANLPPPNDTIEPINPAAPPHLECDALGMANIPGLQTPNIMQLLQGLVANNRRTPSFLINEYQARNFPFPDTPIQFRLPSKPFSLNTKNYHEYTLSLSYTPNQEGDYTFGPLKFKGDVITGADANGQAIMRPISCVGPAVTVRVVPPPETNRPDWFIGSVGTNLSVHGELDASICKVGDPLTLTLDVTGAISLGNMRPPLLNLQPELTTDFRIYDDNVEATAIPSGKRFRYRIRPIREGTLEVPPIQVAWFDTVSRVYRTARTQPIPVQARANTQIVSESTNASTHITRLAVERTTTTPSAITVTPAGARSESLLPPKWMLLAMFASGPLCVLLLWSCQMLYQNRGRMVTAHLRKHALSQAITSLHKVSRAPCPDVATIGHIIRTFLSARLSVTGGSLTAGDVVPLLQAHEVPEATAIACGALLARLDQALYRPDTAADPSAIISDALTLLPQIASALDRPPARKEDAP